MAEIEYVNIDFNRPEHQSENDINNIFRSFSTGTHLYNALGTEGDVIKVKGIEYNDAINAGRRIVIENQI